MKKTTLYIPCCDRDITLAFGLLESIKSSQWGADIFSHIIVMPDNIHSNRQLINLMIKHYGVTILNKEDINDPFLHQLYGGWGYSKLIPFFISPTDKFLVLDADTVFINEPIEPLNLIQDWEVVVDTNPNKPSSYFYDVDKYETINKFSFSIPKKPIFFLSGYLWGTRGSLPKPLLIKALNLQKTVPCIMYPGDQGVLNLCFNHLLAIGKLKLIDTPMQILSEQLEQEAIELYQSSTKNFSFSFTLLQLLKKHRNQGKHILHYEGPWKPYFWSGKRRVAPFMNNFRYLSYKRMNQSLLGSQRLAMAFDDFLPFKKLATKNLLLHPDRLMSAFYFLNPNH
jgi:hypothetical protein